MRDAPELDEASLDRLSRAAARELDGAVDTDAQEQEATRTLLAGSAEARAVLDRLRTLATTARELPEPALPPGPRARIGDALERAARARRWRRQALAAGIASAAVLAAVFALRLRPASVARLPAILRTESGGHRLVDVGDRAVAFLGEDTEIELRAGTPAVVVRRGSVRLVVRPGDGPFVVASPAAEVTVLGTEFDVAVHGDVTEVRVQRGLVEVGNRHGKRRLWPRETARVRPGESPRYIEPLKAIVVDGVPNIEEVPALPTPGARPGRRQKPLP